MEILGTKYELIKNDHSLIEVNIDGECKTYAKVIILCEYGATVVGLEMMSSVNNENAEDERKKRHSEVMRHEVIHAFFNESGLSDYSNNEELVDWLAMQFPKMFKVFQELGCTE